MVCPKLQDIRKTTVFFNGFLYPSAYPSDKSRNETEMNKEQWWNDTDRGKLKYWEKNIIQCGW